MKQHKWHKEIKHLADGGEIEYRTKLGKGIWSDWSVSDDEEVNLKDGIKNTMVTRLGLQVRFTDAETGEIIAASGLGEAKTTRELTLLSDATIEKGRSCLKQTD